MLDSAIKEELTGLFGDLKSKYILNVNVAPVHQQRDIFLELLEDVAACSENISTEIHDGEELNFEIKKDGVNSGIIFRGMPTGHEFSSLLLAILNLDGMGKNLPDSAIAARVKALRGEINIVTYVALTCPNCPDVVQAYNAMAALNGSITHTMVDGAIYKEETDKLFVKSVPSVFLNGELIHVGYADFITLLSVLEERVESDTVEVSTEDQKFDVIVIGGGVAGSTAAIYTARKGLNVAIITENMGGQLNETVDIENFISIPSITGKEMAQHISTHIAKYPIEILENRKIVSLENDGANKRLKSSDGESFVAPAIIIATGARWRRLGIPGEDEYIGRGVSFCSHCDAPFYKDKEVVVVGGGNSAVEATLDLAGVVKKVTIIEYEQELKADKILLDRLESTPNISVIKNTDTKEIVGDGTKVTAIKVMDRATEREYELPADGLFVQIGLLPNSKPFVDTIETMPSGEILIDSSCRSSYPGIYAAGDVSNVPYKQIVIAMGEGAKAALTAFEDRIRGTY